MTLSKSVMMAMAGICITLSEECHDGNGRDLHDLVEECHDGNGGVLHDLVEECHDGNGGCNPTAGGQQVQQEPQVPVVVVNVVQLTQNLNNRAFSH